LEQALAKRGVEQEESAKILRELEEAGLINDERFARAWVNDRDRFAPRGAFLLKRELQQKGIDPGLIAVALAARTSPSEDAEPLDELQQAQALVERVEGRYRGLPEATRQRRLSSFLLRRGFTSDTVRRILNA
jgi:regulatory protein